MVQPSPRLSIERILTSRIEIEPRNADRLLWMQNGTPVSPAGNAIDLKAGDRLAVLSPHQGPVAVFLVPGSPRTWFRQPPHGVTLDSEGVRVTHVPDFRALLSGRTPTWSATP